MKLCLTRNERKHIAAWLVLPLLAVANGAVRDLTYGRGMNHDVAHSLSVFPLVVVIFAVAVVAARRWPLSDARAAARVGAAWLCLTVAFELALGSALQVPPREMLAAYDVTRGRLWALVPLATAVAPALARIWQLRRAPKLRYA